MSEFKIGRLRYTWKGYWNTNTFYNRDAVVSYNGKTYVCLVPHTSGDFYEDIEHYDPEAGFTPYWSIMLDGTEWKGSWSPNTAYTLGNIVLYTGSVYLCTTNHTSGPSVIDLENWETYTTVNSSWASAYESDTLYNVGQVVKYNGIVYRCIEEHTSTLASTIDYTKWELLHVGIEYKGDWSGASYEYRKNDVVKFGSTLWISIQDHTSTEEFDEADWDLWIPGIDYGTTWSELETYQIGDVVKYGGYSYVNKVSNNTNNIPSTNSSGLEALWELLTTGYDLKDSWDSTVTYKIGSVVKRGPNVFASIKDNLNQDPTNTSISKTYVAAGSTGTTLKINDTDSLYPGMIITGPGFSKGQFISSIVDSNTLTINEAPYQTIVDGNIIVFSSINGENWELISSGVRWRNRWSESSGVYSVGDIVAWKNTTYRCIKTHTPDSFNRPDTDTNYVNWVVYLNHDQYNVLNQPGDIVVNSNETNTALGIGSEGFLLKSINGVPTWSNVFQTPAVYYVTPDGTDLPTSGDTWDNPFRSIKYACERIAQGTLNSNFKSHLTSNKQFIINEVAQWTAYQQINSISPFSISNIIDSEKTKRDTSFLLDALLYDLTRGGNSQTIAFVYSYFDQEYSNKYATEEIANLISQFIASISRTFNLLVDVLNNVTVTPLYQELNNIIPVIGQSTGPTHSPQLYVDIQGLQNIIITALSEGNTTSIPPENQGLTATLMVKTGTYHESLPILVPANTALVGDELRGAVVRPKIVINTIAIRTQALSGLITVSTTEGLENNTPIQFASMNPVSSTSTVFGGLIAGVTYYVIGSSITDTQFSVSTVPNGGAVSLLNYVGRMHVYGGDALSDMFLVQNGTGIRNMTLSGLLGTLTAPNEYTTRRPTGGSYVSLDPGQGPNDTSAWIYRKSPYVQNVTTFGIGAVGLKIDGNLHAGGNKSVVCNDFTQIISDGIGVWVTGPESLCEAVSVFTYYNYSGYFAEDGGRIRATNGNSSYGTYGVVAEGFNVAEDPILGKVDNRYYEASATPLSSLGSNAEILKLQYSHAGEQYTTETTNLLVYSNLFTNWNSDGNVTLIQSITSPIGLSDGWIATGNTSGTNSSYFYQDISIAPSGATYTALAGDSQTGGGVDATFDVIVTSTEYIVSVNNGGSGYVTTNQIQINGSRLGGLDGVNDLVITVESLVSGTSISTISTQGTVQVGSIQPYTFSIFCKEGTAESFDVVAEFSGYSPRISGAQYDFSTGEITALSSLGGMTPSIYSITPVYGKSGWHRLSFQFYDITALNDTLQIRIYPRSTFGNAGYTLLYGAQLEIGTTLGFYLKTTTEKFTAHANYDVIGAGIGVEMVADEQRSNAIYQTRVLEINGITGGQDYLVSSNNAQSGDETSLVIAGSDVAGEKDYLGMRLFINSGAGAGQYGIVSSFDTVSKAVGLLKESFRPVTVTETLADSFVLEGTEDINTLYTNQPVQFIPTNYNINVNNISQKTLQVTGTVGGSTNIVLVSSTSRLSVNMPITFSGTTYGGVTEGFTYYVLEILDENSIQVSTTTGGAAVLLNTLSGLSMLLNYPSNTSYLSGNTEDMDINLPIYFTGDVFSDIVPGQTYYINEIYQNNEFSISQSLSVVEASATTANTNLITVDDTSSLRMINPIVFSGTAFGSIVPNQKYYINHIFDLTRITVSANVVDTTATYSLGSSNLISVSSTSGFIIGNPVTFTGTTFGGIVNDKVYYVHYVNNETSFSISNTSSLLSVTATQTFATTNNITVNGTTNLMPLNPITFSGTGFGNISAGTEYYISRIINSTTFRIAPSIIQVEATATESVSNLITVTSTSGFVANNPIIFGGASIGGLVSGTVYYISAINDSTTFTVSAAPGGAAASLTTGTGSMTARTTAASLTLTDDTGSMTGITRFTGTAVDLTTGIGECAVRTTASSITVTTDTGTLTGTSTVVKETLTAGTGNMTGTFSVPLFGGITAGTTYYVSTVTSGPPNTFTVSNAPSGAGITLTTESGSMRMGEVGWDHVNSGTPLVSVFDSTTVYSIEPLITYSKPSYSTSFNNSVTPQAPGTSYVAIAYGKNKFVALPDSNLTTSVSQDGISWSPQQLPSSAAWTDLVYGNNYWVIISSGGSGIPGSKVLYSNSNLVTWKTSYLPSVRNWIKVVYGNGKFVTISPWDATPPFTSAAAYSANFGTTWTSGTGLPETVVWTDLTYGNGRFVAVGEGNIAAYSTNGSTWTAASMPQNVTYSAVTYGNGRFVAVTEASNFSAYSFDGITWYESRYQISGDYISYGNGVFLVTSAVGTVSYTSEDGVVWFVRAVPEGTRSTVFGTDSSGNGFFVGVSGLDFSSTIKTGSVTKARPEVYQGRIVQLNEWEPGSNYFSPPTVTITDSNATKPASVTAMLGVGVLGNPTFYNKGTGYNTTSTSIIINGNGFAENFQVGLQLIFKDLTAVPSAGDNLTISGDPVVYKVTDAIVLDGTTAPNVRALVSVSPSITVAKSPNHNSFVTIRTKYSQVRLTNHDFLNVGYGNVEESNYPGLPPGTLLSPENEAVEVNYGRVFYSSTDQDGNFRVGKLFAVEQATGIVTLSASQFGLEGLSELRLGGIAVGGNSVIITQFSTDSTFVANSNTIIPTQRAIKSYLTARLSQGGANTFTGQLIAGTVLIGGPDRIASTIPEGNEGSHVNIPVKVNVAGFEGGGWDGDGMALYYFMQTFATPASE